MNTIIISSIALIALISLSVTFVKQGTVAVVTIFGKYRRTMHPGFNLRIPGIEIIHKRISIQNKSIEMEFAAITLDQANVVFKSMLLFAVHDEKEETIKKVAFKFIDEKSFMQTLIRSIEGSIRSYVASKKQNEVLGLRKEIVGEVKEHLDHSLESWGFNLLDLQINDITFDEAIMRSMAQVVASNNLKAAAENEGQALLITKTKAAEAEGNAIRIAAQAEMEAAEMRGKGNAMFRENVAKGLALAGKEMEAGKVPPTFMLFTMWLDSMKHVSEHSKGNVIFFDGSNEGMDRTMRQMQAMEKIEHTHNGNGSH